MATLKDVQLKISAVKKTKQITKAMNMVAASKLRGAQSAMESFRPYAGKFREVLGSLSQRAGGDDVSPLLVPREDVHKINLLVCTSDRGLCGGFNANLTARADQFIKAHANEDVDIHITAFGKKGRDWARKKRLPLVEEHLGVVGGRFDFSIAADAGQRIVNDFVEEEFDEVHVIYAEFVSMARQIPRLEQLLPIPPVEDPEEDAAEAEGTSGGAYMAEHICEPSAAELLGELLPRNVYVRLYSALLETSASEHAARMAAMDNATKACKDMIESLTLTYNKARQAAITTELMDIIGGAEALKG